ncbi:flippase-like domain-containing protein [Candidatus Sumerlaeota bacterium]|nr:flippase-like domain-containing protein [Candidatus Sumerlaeota bacterium]
MKKILLHWVIPLAITVGLLALAFSLIEPENRRRIPGYIAAVPWHVHVLFVLVTLISMWLRAIRWRALLPDFPLTTRKCFGPLMIGFMMNALFPARAGEFARSVVLGRKEKIPFTSVLGSVLLERIFDGVVLLASFAIVLAILGTVLPPEISFGDKSITSEDLQVAVRGATIGVIIVLAGIIGLLIPAVRRIFESIAHATLPQRWGNTVVDQMEKLVSGFRSLHSPLAIVIIILWTLAVWATVALSCQIGAWGFEDLAEMSFLEAWAITVFVCIFILLPAAPGYWGFYELGVIFACATLGLTTATEVALAYSVVIHLWQIVVTVAVGLIYAWAEGLHLGQLRHRAETDDSPLSERE